MQNQQGSRGGNVKRFKTVLKRYIHTAPVVTFCSDSLVSSHTQKKALMVCGKTRYVPRPVCMYRYVPRRYVPRRAILKHPHYITALYRIISKACVFKTLIKWWTCVEMRAAFTDACCFHQGPSTLRQSVETFEKAVRRSFDQGLRALFVFTQTLVCV